MSPAEREALEVAGLRIKDIPAAERARYFVRVDQTVLEGVGFRSKLHVDVWIGLHGRVLDWRAGYVFRLKSLRKDIAIIDEHGVVVD